MATAVVLVLLGAPASAQDDPPPRPTVPPVGEAIDIGEVVLVDSSDPTTVLTEGGSATRFTIRLPQGATCPGDSANDDWRISTFLVPESDDLSSLVMAIDTPEGEDQWVLASPVELDDAGRAIGGANPFINELLIANAVPGLPGVVAPFPEFSFSAYPEGLLESGEWRIGAACSWRFVVTQYWDAPFTIQQDDADEPAGFTWTVPAPSEDTVEALGGDAQSAVLPGEPSGGDGGGNNAVIWFVVAGVALVASGVFFVLGQRREVRAAAESSQVEV